jgi:hypothetical protein
MVYLEGPIHPLSSAPLALSIKLAILEVLDHGTTGIHQHPVEVPVRFKEPSELAR